MRLASFVVQPLVQSTDRQKTSCNDMPCKRKAVNLLHVLYRQRVASGV